MAIAAIDCGTNSTRLLVSDDDAKPRVRLMRITRLGEGVDADHRLAPAAIDRTLAVLEEYREVMDDEKVTRARMVATSAVRDAANGEDFLSRASDVVGTPAELLSGEEEGLLSYSGATADLPPAAGDDVVVDIGGGSTELIAGRSGAVDVISLDLGCVRLTERYLRHDPPTPSEVASTVAAIDADLERATASVPVLGDLRPGSRLIGLAGTVATISMLDQSLAAYDRDAVHHSILTLEAVRRWCETLGARTAHRRLALPGMVPGREDVILGGALVLRQVMVRFGFDRCLVSESDILDGLVASLLR